MNKKHIVNNTIRFVKKVLKDAEGGHDWFHTERVYNTSIKIAEHEKVDSFVVALGALLHDTADSKFNNGNEKIGPDIAENFLKTQGISDIIINQVVYIIQNISFKNSLENKTIEMTPELAIVQDADRLDAIGAIGIARAFNYGGFINSAIYNPDIKPLLEQDKETYKKSKAPTINHFYEKLLLLKEKMNTEAGKKIAEQRHKFMELFLEQFYKEWYGKR